MVVGGCLPHPLKKLYFFIIFFLEKKYLNKRFSNLQKNMAKIRKYRLGVPKLN